jgi:hypothetical protein
MLVTEVACLAKFLNAWASEVADATGIHDIKVVPCFVLMDPWLTCLQNLLRKLLDTAVVYCAPSIQAFLAASAAPGCFPRSFVRSVSEEDCNDGEAVMFTVEVRLGRSRRVSVSHYACSSHWKVWETHQRRYPGNPTHSLIWYI